VCVSVFLERDGRSHMNKLIYFMKVSIRPMVSVSEFHFEPHMFAHR
jgi:hypothetical protein